MTEHPAPALAAPYTLAGLPLRNRLVVTAHATAAVTDGAPTEADAAYWHRLARGGAGMVITGGTVVAPESTLPQRYLAEAWRPEIKDAVRRRADPWRGGRRDQLGQRVLGPAEVVEQHLDRGVLPLQGLEQVVHATEQTRRLGHLCHGLVAEAPGFHQRPLGMPRMRSAITLRWISFVPA